MNISRKIFPVLAALSISFATPVFSYADDTTSSGTAAAAPASAGANGTADPNNVSENKCDINSLKGKFESQGDGGYAAVNKDNGVYWGKYQMGTSALEDMGFIKAGTTKKYGASGLLNSANWTGKDGINSTTDWVNNPSVQEATEPLWEAKQASYMSSYAKSQLGQALPGCGGTFTQASYLMGAHLMGSAGVDNFLKGGGECLQKGETAANGYTYTANTKDGTKGGGTCIKKYMCAGSNCQTIDKDMNKKTCSTTMTMIKGISCSNYTGETLALCNYAQPHLMTEGECESAEGMAHSAKKGPNEAKCENSTFGPGTGSWSYALACSWGSSAIANQDGTTESGETPESATKGATGIVSDPECMKKLDALGVQYDKIGQFYNGTFNGTTCVIENAVALRGTALPFAGQKLNMTCDMALAMETFGAKIKAIGVTGYFGIGSTRECGPMRDKRGNLPGTITNHALGMAVDFTGVIYQGHKISMGQIHAPNTPDGAFALQVKALACSTFRTVLSPTYAQYTGTFIHNHVEWAKLNVCR